MRSSPQDGLFSAISRMSILSFFGIGGRPGRDFHRQNSLNPCRCQPINVRGCTTVNAIRQLNSLEREAQEIFVRHDQVDEA